ncbi:MAG: capsid protein [Rhodoplanes sp.]|uniref:capsid protein n=1 Tax=Rhodoplanes sp. TaxID=1968906 RepID=UPI0017E4364B|nr:capsid protein [Rhodoplanes sp.]NVO16100.1 capsid protein [Rhodoplanes sp.]
MAPNRPFEVNPILTAVAIGYRNPDYALIAARVLPYAPVPEERFKYTVYPLNESFNVPDDLRIGRKGQPHRVEFSAKQETGEVDDWGVDTIIPQSDIDTAARQRSALGGHYDPRAYAAQGLTDIVDLGHEVRTARLVFNLQSYAPARRITLSGTSQLSDYVNSDPFGVFDAAMAGTLVFKPNTAVFGDEAWRIVRGHPHLVNAVRGGVTNKGRITPEEFAALFGLRSVVVGEGWLNTAKKGQEPTLERVWGRHCAFLHLATSPTTEKTVTFGYTARLGNRIAGDYQDPSIGLQGATIVRVGERAKELIIAPDVGYFIQNIVAGA